MQTNKLINSDSLDKTKCYLDKDGITYLGKFKETKSIVRYGRQTRSNIFKHHNSMDDNFIETPCMSNTPPSTYNRSRMIIRGGRHGKHNSITKNRRCRARKSKKNNRRN
jgi:hypothetical protein